MQSFKNSIFTKTACNTTVEIAQAIAHGNLVMASGIDFHAYTTTGYDESTGEFIVRDTTGDTNEFVPAADMAARFVNNQAITGVKIDPTSGTGGWSSGEQTSVIQSTGSSTGNP